MKRALFISYDGMTDPLGQSQVLPYLTGLSTEYEMHLLSCEKPENYSSTKQTIEDICNENNIHWHPITYHKSPPVLSSIYDYQNLLKTAKKLHKQHNFSIIHCRSYIPAMVGLALKKEFGTKFLFDMRGFWADERKDSGLWNTGNPLFGSIYNFFKKKEKQFVTESDYIISLTHAGKKEMQSWGLNNLSPIQVIPCCADFDLFDYRKVNGNQIEAEKEKLGLSENDFVLTYLGSIGTWYMLDEMLDFFVELKKEYGNAKFQFITREPAEIILNKASERGLSSQDFIIAPASRKEVPVRLAVSDASIFFIRTYYSKKASSPTKQAEIMGMGLPLVCNSGIGDVDQIVEESDTGLKISECKTEDYSFAVKQIPNLLKLEKEKIRREGLSRFSLKDGVDRYKFVYKEMLKTR